MQPADANLWVQFYTHPVEIKHKSEKEGRPIYEDRDYVRIQIPGDDTTMIERPVIKDGSERDDTRRFPAAWEAYRAGREAPIDGTPVDQWPAISRAQAEELKRLKCFTLEQLVATSDQQAKKLGMGVFELRTRAAAYLEVTKNTASAQKYAVENERLREDLERQGEDVKRLTALVESLQRQVANGKAA